MAGPKSEDGGVASSPSGSNLAAARDSSTGHESQIRPAAIIYGLATIVGVGVIVAGYLVLQPKATNPVNRQQTVPATSPWKPIAERVLQAEQGRFPMDEGILSFSTSADASDREVRSVMGTFELPRYGAAQIESGESWGVTGANRDEFVMYVHNFLDVPITAMMVRLSEGNCASYGPQSKTTWASAYWGNALPAGKEAVFHATMPAPYALPSYCAVVYRVYSSRTP